MRARAQRFRRWYWEILGPVPIIWLVLWSPVLVALLFSVIA